MGGVPRVRPGSRHTWWRASSRDPWSTPGLLHESPRAGCCLVSAREVRRGLHEGETATFWANGPASDADQYGALGARLRDGLAGVGSPEQPCELRRTDSLS